MKALCSVYDQGTLTSFPDPRPAFCRLQYSIRIASDGKLAEGL